MGRTLDTLRKGTGGITLPDAPTLPHGQKDRCVMEWAVGDEQVPFIEVGGPGKLLEGSADVLTTHPAQAKQPPHRPTEKALTRSALMVELADVQPLAASYEPWTGPLAASGKIAPEVVTFHHPEHAVSKQYAELTKQMLHGLSSGTSHVMVVAGIGPHVGTTTVLVNIAVAAAQAGRRLLLVDVHLQRPGIAARLGIDADVGLQEVLDGRAALDEAIVKTVAPHLHLLPARDKPSDLALTQEAATWLIGVLRSRFDLVLLDAPPLDGLALLSLAPVSDALYLVAPQGHAAPLDRHLLHQLTRKGARLRGILHTQIAK